MLCKGIQHVVKKTNAGADLAITWGIKIPTGFDLRLFGVAGKASASCHGEDLSAQWIEGKPCLIACIGRELKECGHKNELIQYPEWNQSPLDRDKSTPKLIPDRQLHEQNLTFDSKLLLS